MQLVFFLLEGICECIAPRFRLPGKNAWVGFNMKLVVDKAYPEVSNNILTASRSESVESFSDLEHNASHKLISFGALASEKTNLFKLFFLSRCNIYFCTILHESLGYHSTYSRATARNESDFSFHIEQGWDAKILLYVDMGQRYIHLESPERAAVESLTNSCHVSVLNLIGG